MPKKCGSGRRAHGDIDLVGLPFGARYKNAGDCRGAINKVQRQGSSELHFSQQVGRTIADARAWEKSRFARNPHSAQVTIVGYKLQNGDIDEVYVSRPFCDGSFCSLPYRERETINQLARDET